MSNEQVPSDRMIGGWAHLALIPIVLLVVLSLLMLLDWSILVAGPVAIAVQTVGHAAVWKYDWGTWRFWT